MDKSIRGSQIVCITKCQRVQQKIFLTHFTSPDVMIPPCFLLFDAFSTVIHLRIVVLTPAQQLTDSYNFTRKYSSRVRNSLLRFPFSFPFCLKKKVFFTGSDPPRSFPLLISYQTFKETAFNSMLTFLAFIICFAGSESLSEFPLTFLFQITNEP